jgi:hypothetical protein
LQFGQLSINAPANPAAAGNGTGSATGAGPRANGAAVPTAPRKVVAGGAPSRPHSFPIPLIPQRLTMLTSSLGSIGGFVALVVLILGLGLVLSVTKRRSGIR